MDGGGSPKVAQNETFHVDGGVDISFRYARVGIDSNALAVDTIILHGPIKLDRLLDRSGIAIDTLVPLCR